MTNSFPILFFLHFRTESVAEKMLTNWFTFLLYKFLKVRESCFEAFLLGEDYLG